MFNLFNKIIYSFIVVVKESGLTGPVVGGYEFLKGLRLGLLVLELVILFGHCVEVVHL